MSFQGETILKFAKILERIPPVRTAAIKIYGSKKFNPHKTTYRKSTIDFFHILASASPVILFDAQCLQSPTIQRGIGHYSLNFIREVCTAFPNEQFGAFLTNIGSQERFEIARRSLEQQELVNLNIYVLDAFKASSKPTVNQAIEAIAEQIKEIQPKVLMSMSSFEKAATAVPTPIVGNIKNAAILYDLIPLYYPKSLLVSRKQKTFYSWVVQRIKQIDVLLSISQTSKKSWLELVGNVPKIEVIYGGPNKLSHPSSGNALAKRNGILVVGAEQPHKNIPFVIHAYSNLPKEIQQIHPLKILGIRSAGYRAKLKRIAETNGSLVTIPGYISQKELEAQYKSHRILVMPSFLEGLSMPILEAWSSGLVVLGSKSSVASELISHSSALFDPHFLPSLEEKLIELLTDDEKWLRMQSQNNNLRQDYSWSKTVRSSFAILFGEI